MSPSRTGDAAASLYCEIDGLTVEVAPTDVGIVGLFAKTTTPLPIDSEVEIFLRSALGSITIAGTVVQVVDVERAASEHRAPGFGVLFAHVSAQARAWIEGTLAAATTAAPDTTRSTHRSSPTMPAVTPSPPPARRTPPPEDSPSTPTPTSRPVRVDPRVAATLAVLERELEGARGKAAWALLGVERNAPRDAIRDAYLDASRRYHPHRFARFESDEITRLATELFVVHKRAYAALTSESGRPKRTDSTPIPLPAAGTERGADEVTRQRFVDPKVAIAAGLKHLSIGRLGEAAKALEQALELDPRSSQARLWLLVCQARGLTADGEHEQARAKYLDVLAIDPKHREALRETGQGDGRSGPTRRLRR